MSESIRKHKAEAPRKLGFGVFICSTSRYQKLAQGEKPKDVSGSLIESYLKEAGHKVLFRKIIADNKTMIEQGMQYAFSLDELDCAIFCGGTGIAPSDITIETVSPFLEKTLPGFGEIFRHLSFGAVGSAAVLSRAIAGVAERKAFFCIPGSPDAVRLCFERLILPEAPHIVKHARE
ncbi:MAG: MogA/MoaB family molybdenum cofactor biosynthesis protein [Candidatus Bathyarchaeota archaeon]|nr:MogA/MoaB family molybdenum cofactor biosynthesis protein [Candidatus Bathyarchaeota archaeon]